MLGIGKIIQLGPRQKKAVGSQWVPTDLDGLVLWLRADSITGLDDGDAVGTWEDGSGQGNDVTQNTADKKPLYKTNIQNGLPVVRADGSDDLLSKTSTDIVSGACSYYAVCKVLSSQTGYRGILRPGQLPFMTRMGTDKWGVYAGGDVPSGYVLTDAFHVIGVVARNYDDIDLWTDGSKENKTNGTGWTASGGLHVLTNATQYSNMDLGELFVCNTALSDADDLSARQYLADRWGITL